MNTITPSEDESDQVIMSSETHPISFHGQREPNYRSEIEHFDPFPEPTAEQGRRRLAGQEAAGVQARERLDQERAEAAPFLEETDLERLAQDEGCAHRHQSVPVPLGTQAPDQLVARDGGDTDEVREKTPPVVAEESEFARQNRQSQELAWAKERWETPGQWRQRPGHWQGG